MSRSRGVLRARTVNVLFSRSKSGIVRFKASPMRIPVAQAGGKNPAGIPDAIASVKDALSGMIK